MQAFLLFSHQLYADAARQPRTQVMVLIEDAKLFRPGENPARAIFHRAALQAVRERLLVKGFAVEYLGADEYPTLEAAFAWLASQHPEVVRCYELNDATLEKQLGALLKNQHIPFLTLPSPVPRVKVKSRRSFVPQVLPPVEPNRYVEEAALYYGKLVPVTQEIEFAYPVTRGDAEEWLDALPQFLHSGENLKAVAQDLAPLFTAGLLDLPTVETWFQEARVASEHQHAFRLLLTS